MGLYKRWRGWASTGSGTHKETLLGRLGVYAWPLQYRPAGAFSLLLEGCCAFRRECESRAPRARPECEKDCWRNSQLVKFVLVKSAHHAALPRGSTVMVLFEDPWQDPADFTLIPKRVKSLYIDQSAGAD